jgi:hypothetical protein
VSNQGYAEASYRAIREACCEESVIDPEEQALEVVRIVEAARSRAAFCALRHVAVLGGASPVVIGAPG